MVSIPRCYSGPTQDNPGKDGIAKRVGSAAFAIAGFLLLSGYQEPAAAASESSPSATAAPAYGDASLDNAKQLVDWYDYAGAYRQFLPLAEAGNPEAQYYLGWMHFWEQPERGERSGVPQDGARAARWYLRAAEQGFADAQYNLGWMYQNGRGVAQDADQALEWFRKAAEQGLVNAAHSLDGRYGEDWRALDNAETCAWHLEVLKRRSNLELGRLTFTWYEFGGIVQHFVQAVERVKGLAEQGDADAQFSLGTIYENAKCYQKQDHVEAVKWYRMAADQGLADAQYNLGTAYYTGYGVPAQDYAEAARWLGKAAGQGSASSLSVLGFMYYAGNGVPQDNVKAYMLYKLALEPGRDLSGNLREALKTARSALAFEMTPTDIGRAQQLAIKCARQHYRGCF